MLLKANRMGSHAATSSHVVFFMFEMFSKKSAAKVGVLRQAGFF